MKRITILILRIWALLPLPILQMLGTLIGIIHHFANSRAAQVTTVNLEMCRQSPNLRLASLKETGKTMLETPAIWLGSTDRIDAWIADVYGETLLADSVSGEKGLLILLPHLGNWELFNVFYRRFGDMTALYQTPRSALLQDLMKLVRESHGNEMVPTDRRGLKRLYTVLQKGGTVAVLPDQVPSSGHFVPFFGHSALTDELVIRLQKKTGAKLLMLFFLRRTDGYFDMHVLDVWDELYEENIRDALTAFNGMLESVIALKPAQYQWEYKRFRERPVGEKKVYHFKNPTGLHE